MMKKAKQKLFLVKADTLRRFTSFSSMFVAGILILAKLYAFLETGSVALLSSLVDSGVDLLASSISAYGVILAMRPADREHRYGHGKAESLAALVQAIFIIVSSALLVREAIGRLITPVPLENLEVGYATMGLAIFMTVLLLALQTYTVARTKSLAIAADRLHYIGDILINVAVIATFAFQSQLDVQWIDPCFAIFIAGGMCVGAVKIIKMALSVLMDTELPEKDREVIKTIILNVAGVHGVHDMRTRTDNGRSIIEAHIEMDPHISLRQAHDICEAVSESIEAVYPKADILLHQDPVGINEPRLDHVIEQNHHAK